MPLITSENAAELGRKGALARLEALAKRKAEEQAENERLAKLSTEGPDYQQERLARVRKQLNKLDRMIEEEEDPQKLDRLASAQSRLAKQEQELSGRPLPGSLRPTKKPTARSSNIPDPVD